MNAAVAYLDARTKARAIYRQITDLIDCLDLQDIDPDVIPVQTIDERIQDMAHAVHVKTEWHTPTLDRSHPDQYRIVLSADPAVHLIGELYRGDPITAALMYRSDDSVGWSELRADIDLLLRFASRFWLGSAMSV